MAGDFGDVKTPQPCDSGVRVRRSGARQPRQNSNGLFEFVGEHISVNPVLDPPFPLEADMPPSRKGESDPTRFQRERSSRRMSSASTRRPASTSAPDSRRASWRAARPSSSSQSPGSSGRSCSSVPSGRSVGSSMTRRPWRTRALMVMQTSVASSRPPNKQMEPTRSARSRVPARAAHLQRQSTRHATNAQ